MTGRLYAKFVKRDVTLDDTHKAPVSRSPRLFPILGQTSYPCSDRAQSGCEDLKQGQD